MRTAVARGGSGHVEATAIETPDFYPERIRQELANCLVETALPFGRPARGKVRDRYDLGDRLLLVATDRQSAFDRVVAAIPFKGQVLNLTSAWWFERTRHIVPNHVLAVPDPNVTLARKCEVFPIEFVVRGYITGTTDTSLWTVYRRGVRRYCGIDLPEGLVKNQRLDTPLLTPTTKEDGHDRPIAPDEIVAEGWMTAGDWERCRELALELFTFGRRCAAAHGLLLVDTKYEMGRTSDGEILLVDEIHTPDSSRYWIAESYERRLAAGEEPESVDKEFLRLWFRERCDPYRDAELPAAPEELVVELSRRYLFLYEKITGERFRFPEPGVPAERRIRAHLEGVL